MDRGHDDNASVSSESAGWISSEPHMCLVNSFCHTKQTARTLNPLTPNDHYSGRTAPLASKRCILYIYSTNIGTECF